MEQMHVNGHPLMMFGQRHSQKNQKVDDQTPQHVQAYPQRRPELLPPGPTGYYPPSLFYDQQQQQLYNHNHQQQMQLQYHEQERQFWEHQKAKIDEEFEADVKSPALPLARIKRIMRADEDVRMIAHETPLVFNKACEMFIFDLMQRAWRVSEDNKRKTVNKTDIFEAVRRNNVFDFLDDIMPHFVVPRSNVEHHNFLDEAGAADAGPSSSADVTDII